MVLFYHSFIVSIKRGIGQVSRIWVKPKKIMPRWTDEQRRKMSEAAKARWAKRREQP